MTVLTQSVASAYVQSVARFYQEGIHLVAAPREDILTVSLQNRSNKTIYFWHGWAYESLAAQSSDTRLPLDPNEWTTGQLAGFRDLIRDYGETVAPGGTINPAVAQRMQLYSYVTGQAGGAEAHVKVGRPKPD